MPFLWFSLGAACIFVLLAGGQAVRLVQSCSGDLARLDGQLMASQVQLSTAEQQINAQRILLHQAESWLNAQRPTEITAQRALH